MLKYLTFCLMLKTIFEITKTQSQYNLYPLNLQYLAKIK